MEDGVREGRKDRPPRRPPEDEASEVPLEELFPDAKIEIDGLILGPVSIKPDSVPKRPGPQGELEVEEASFELAGAGIPMGSAEIRQEPESFRSQPTSSKSQLPPPYKPPRKPPPSTKELKERKSHSAVVVASAVKFEYIYGMLGLVLGLASIICGMILGLNGVAGATSWTARLLGLESKINDAAPGVVLFIVGIFLVWITKPRVSLRKLRG